VLSRIFNNQSTESAEERAISFQTLWASGDTLTLTTPSGVGMNQEEAMKLEAIYACVRLISDSISTLPIDTFVRRDGTRTPFRPRPDWLDMPEVGVSRTEHFQQVLISLLVSGDAFVHILRDDQGIAGLSVLNPRHVEIRRSRTTRRPEYVVDQGRFVIAFEDMIHITDMLMPGEMRGRSRIDLAKDTLGLARALELSAQLFFGQGSQVGGLIEFPGNLTREQAKDLVDSFEQNHKSVRRAHRPGVLFGGAKFVKTSVQPNEAQSLESRQYSVEQIARLFKCPPSLLSVTTPGAMSYASVEQNAIQFVTHCLRPHIVKIEDAYSQKLLPGTAFMSFNVNGLLRGSTIDRFSAYSQGLTAGFFSVNDVRKFEDMPPVDGGDVNRVPLANVDLDAANLTELEKKASIVQRLIFSGYDPAAILEFLGLPDITHTGVPSTQLQPISQIDPEDPKAAYEVGA
jgi:HK97 family phage portal protein